VRVLGGFELIGADGGSLALSGRKLRALVALLALPPSLGWSREQLTALLWGDRDEELARGSLRQALAELRRLIGDAPLVADRETVALDPAAVTIDAIEFAALSAGGQWDKAATLYRGDLLAGVSLPNGAFADWLLVERTRHHDLAIQVLGRLLERQSGDQAIETAVRLQALDPDREQTYRTLMQLHAAKGDRSQALRQYQLCRDHLQRDLGVKPEPETERLFEEIKSHVVRTAPPSAPESPQAAPSPPAQPVLPAAQADSAAPPRPRWWMAAGLALMLLAGGGLAYWLTPWQRTPDVAAVPPSIAVLPFENMTDDPKQTYFADGITEDLMTDLSRVNGLRVVGRNSTFAYRDQDVDVRKVASALGVRYVIEGSVRRAGDEVRINVQLVDAATGNQQWAQRYDGSLRDIFALQDQVAGAVVNALSLRLTAGEQRELARHETASLEAYDAFLRGWERYRLASPDELAKAIPHFEQAIELDPNYGRAHAALAMIYFQAYDQAWAGRLEMSGNDVYRRAQKQLTIAMHNPTSTAHQVAGNIYRDRGWYDEALKEFNAAIALDPNDSWTYAYSAYALIWAGKPAEADAQIATAMRLDPNPPPLFLFYQGLAQFTQDRLAEAAATLRKAVERSPDDPWPMLYLASTYGRSGKTKEAADTMAALNTALIKRGGMPFVLAQLHWKTLPLEPPEPHRLTEGLLRAGVPHWYTADATGPSPFEEDKLTGSEVDQLFFGHRLHGRSIWSGSEYGASISADGSAMMFGEWGTGNGIARLEGSQLCFEWTSGTTNCGWVFRNPGGMGEMENEYIWVSHQRGEFTFSQAD
jgi:TolB-like protein/DNA-binding SARP family transcriptional activator/Flp pilus assembly protein TadD